jgi:hypothetical protein
MISVVGIKKSVKSGNALSAGIEYKGDKYTLAEDINDPCLVDADCFIQTNLLKPKFYSNGKNEPYEYILNSKKPFLVLESPVFRKHAEYRRLGWWSYKWGDANFNNINSSSDRWNKFQKTTNLTIKPWRSSGDYILIMGQKEGDSSLSELYKKFNSFAGWVDDIVHTIQKHTDRKIVIRPHIRNSRHGLDEAHRIAAKHKNVFVSENMMVNNGTQGGEGLQRDLDGAYCVVTYNSLSAVEAICEGIPTFALNNGSMIWPIAHKDLSKIENLDRTVDITQWCNDVAYTQWSGKEFKSGEAWAHLRPVYFK